MNKWHFPDQLHHVLRFETEMQFLINRDVLGFYLLIKIYLDQCKMGFFN